jgi:hypothetical protein
MLFSFFQAIKHVPKSSALRFSSICQIMRVLQGTGDSNLSRHPQKYELRENLANDQFIAPGYLASHFYQSFSV